LLSVEGIFWVVLKLVVGRLQLSRFLWYRSELFIHEGLIRDFEKQSIVNDHPFRFY
jgi:hypothetical protein